MISAAYPLGLSSSQIPFYSTAATVLPILLLAFAVQLPTVATIKSLTRVRKIASRRTALALGAVGLACIVLMFVAELLALGALLYNGNREPKAVMLALVVGMLLVMFGVIERLESALVEAAKSEMQPKGVADESNASELEESG